MLKIGIVGGNEILNTANLLRDIFISKGIETKTLNYTSNSLTDYKNEFSNEISGFIQNENTGVLIEKIFNDSDVGSPIENDFDVLIINSLDEDSAIHICNNKRNDIKNNIILLNSDEKNIFKALQDNVGNSRVITYGLNSKACVTASSISDCTVQCCIQRALPTFSGGVLEQQEFTVKADTQTNDINGILAAVTAAIVNGCDTNFDLH